ncbi:uncharacterized protein SCHCODRAFT_02640296 [Schizophyllum commune H4-8]|uniref:uncharacterized protein n=1 Tax=Schizophyllum commune (strain H4-8 / FGSC 9210) TaxID=578458 RepID=UPI002160EA58|nr:uncharacterized protein SCHCODRAFT_02640296 [Schizophyllum commune H4-8]KAI5886920.1 hypothetical protein SCHCODRAFT_02640296 [Schizophyllum commune H4-8]
MYSPSSLYVLLVVLGTLLFVDSQYAMKTTSCPSRASPSTCLHCRKARRDAQGHVAQTRRSRISVHASLVDS